MTIQNESIKAGPFDGNDSTTVFPFTFKVFQAADLDVIFTSTTAVESTLVLDTDYSVSLNADQEASPGGNVTYPVAGDPLATGEKLTILNGVAFEQGTDLQNGGAWNPETVENALDKVTMLAQRNQEEIARSVKVDVSSDSTPDELLQDIDDAVLAAQAAQTGAETAQSGAQTAQSGAETAETGSQTAQAASEDAQSYSEEWANKAEDSLVSAAAGGGIGQGGGHADAHVDSVGVRTCPAAGDGAAAGFG